MTKDLIELEEAIYGGTYIVNINNITFHTESHTLFINGVTGDGNSIIQITKESHERLMKMAKLARATFQVTKRIRRNVERGWRK